MAQGRRAIDRALEEHARARAVGHLEPRQVEDQHAAGVAGAPKAGDKGAWAPRIARGTAELVKSVMNGKGAMPPKGGGADLSDAEVKAAVEHLLGLSK